MGKTHRTLLLCSMCFVIQSTVAHLTLLKSSFGVCKLKQLELQFNLQDRRAHSVGLSCEGDCFYIVHPTTRVHILTQYTRDIRALLHKVEQFYCKASRLNWDGSYLWQCNVQIEHPLRIGEATEAAAAGLPDWLIQTAGRWRSDAYKRYIQDHK